VFSARRPLEGVDRLCWQERWLFDYWAHAASIVLTEDRAPHHLLMRAYPHGVSDYGNRLAAWVDGNGLLRAHILQRLEEEGPLPNDRFEDRPAVPRPPSGWTNGRNVERMLSEPGAGVPAFDSSGRVRDHRGHDFHGSIRSRHR
jgi:uncharacterized protein YcaQ